jgi:hypothetical protein
VRNSSFRESRETVIDENDLNSTLNQANAIKTDYFRLRALAALSLLRLSGKRRTEICWIPLENFKFENDLLTVTFTLEKKKRKHEKCPDCNTQNTSASLFCKNCDQDISECRLLSHLGRPRP